jgi:hypothetical protein
MSVPREPGGRLGDIIEWGAIAVMAGVGWVWAIAVFVFMVGGLVALIRWLL